MAQVDAIDISKIHLPKAPLVNSSHISYWYCQK